MYIIWVYSVWISAKLNLSYHVKFYGVQIFLPYIVIFFLDVQTTIMLVSICFFSKAIKPCDSSKAWSTG